MKKKSENIIVGVLIIATAILWMLNELGVMRNINLGHIVFTALWGTWLIKGLIQRKSFVVFMSLAFLAIVWDKELGIEAITPWPIIGAAILLTIGFSFIFEKNGRKEWEENQFRKHHNFDNNYKKMSTENRTEWENDNNKEQWKNNNTTEKNTTYGTAQSNKSYEDGEHVYHINRFSGTEKYIDSQNLKSVEIINKVGGMEVYLDKAKAAGDKVYMRIECYAGGIEIYIPRNWKLENHVDCIMGAVEEPGNIDSAGNDVILEISGKIIAGGIEIIRV